MVITVSPSQVPSRNFYPWYILGKNFGMNCRLLLQEIFPTQGLNRHLWFNLSHWAGPLQKHNSSKQSLPKLQGLLGCVSTDKFGYTRALQISLVIQELPRKSVIHQLKKKAQFKKWEFCFIKQANWRLKLQLKVVLRDSSKEIGRSQEYRLFFLQNKQQTKKPR